MKQRLIDANKASAELACYYGGIVDETLYDFASDIINEAPTVEAITIDWIKKYIEDNTQLMINPEYENTEFTEEPIDYYIKLYPYQINTMLKAWEEENELLCD